jgi:hypothetical protein
MPSFCRQDSCFHAGRASANDGDLFRRGRGFDHPIDFVRKTQLRVYGAHIEVGGINIPVAFIAADAGHYILASAFVCLIAIFRIADKGPAHGDQIGFTACDILLVQVQVLESADGCCENLRAAFLYGLGITDCDGFTLL